MGRVDRSSNPKLADARRGRSAHRAAWLVRALACSAALSCGALAGDDPPEDPGSAGPDAGAIDDAAADDLARTEAGSAASDAGSPGEEVTCPAATPPGAVARELVTPAKPVRVPPAFMGIHRGLHQPQWLPTGGAPIPAPTYAYGYVRTLKVDVDGLEERGFWSNIETSKGNYDFTSMDKWMSANADHPVVWLVYGTPPFYQKYPGEPSRWPSWSGIASPPTDAGHAALEKYVQAVRARYGAQIAAFEVWNEPTLPWTGGATSYDDRWTPAWGQANAPWNPAPFFSGSASDLANIAYTLDHANLGVPVLGGGFVDQAEAGQHTVTRFLDAPVTLPGGAGTGKDHVQALSIHFYDYSFDPSSLLGAVEGYRSKLAAAGIGDLPIWDTETGAEGSGAFEPNDARAPVNIQRWVYLAAAERLASILLYGHVSGSDAARFLGDPIHDANVAAALDKASRISGSVICNAATLVDGRVWIHTHAGDDLAI